MPIIRAQVVIPFKSGLPTDVAVNTFHFDAPTYGVAARTGIVSRLTQLYNAATANGHVIANSLANVVNRAADAAQIRMYDLSAPEPREPSVSTWTVGPAGFSTAIDLPAEVAICGSFYATRNLPQRRGRIYFGPFVTSIGAEESVDKARPQLATTEGIAQALDRLKDANNGDATWVVYSRPKDATLNKDGSPNPSRPGAGYTVTAGFVDNAWDIQRRRGQAPSLRTVFS